MSRGNYWLRNGRWSRRSVIRSAALGTAGLAGAALIGCGDDDESTDSTAPATGTPSGAATAAPAADPSAIKPGGTVQLRSSVVIPNMDFHANVSSFVTNAITFFYNGLLRMDPFDEEVAIADLAHSFEIADPTTLVFHLNEAQFHDGAELVAEDVANSFDRILDPPEGALAPRRDQLSNVQEVETPDERTAILHLGRPSASIITTLAVPDFAIYSSRDIFDDGFDHWDDVNGTGPFMLDRHDRDVRVTRNRNPNYFAAGDGGIPYVDHINTLIIPDDTNAFSAFATGDLDYYLTTATNAPLVEDMNGASLTAKGGSAWWSTVVATWKEPFDDPRVWQAVALTINKHDVNLVHNEGHGGVSALLPPGGPFALSEENLLQVMGYKGLGDGQEADIETRRTEAARLLDAAGVPEGTHVELFGWDNAEDWGTIFQDSLERLGFSVNLYIAERAEFVQRLQDHTYGDMAASTRSTAFGDPTPSFTDSYVTDAPRAYNGLSVPEVDELFDLQEQTLDFEERHEIATRMMMTYLDVYPAEVASFTATLMAMHDWVNDYGVVYGNSGFLPGRREQMWLDK